MTNKIDNMGVAALSLLLLLLFTFNSFGQEKLKLVYQGPVSFDKIVQPGAKYVFKQFCRKDVDSVVSSGEIMFKKALVMDLEVENLLFVIEDDTLLRVQFEVKGKEQVGHLKDLSKNVLGDSLYLSGSEKKGDYLWSSDTTGTCVLNKRLAFTSRKATLLLDCN